MAQQIKLKDINPGSGVGNKRIRAKSDSSQLETTSQNAFGIITDSGTSRTLALTDGEQYIRFTSGSSISVTVPTNASVAFPVGTTIALRQAAAGVVTVVASGGVTVNAPYAGTLVSAGQGALLQLIKVATDTWDLTGPTVSA